MAIADPVPVLSTFVASKYHLSRRLNDLGVKVDALASTMGSVSERLGEMSSSPEKIYSSLEEMKGSMGRLETHLHKIDNNTRRIDEDLRKMQGWMNGFAVRQVNMNSRHMSMAEKIIKAGGVKKDRPLEILEQVESLGVDAKSSDSSV
ncbi:MAG: hypothetical protein Q9208_007777 [Pyrenodesmia sp. 3 TL-2023]